MLGVLEWILATVKDFGILTLWAIMESVDTIAAAVVVAFGALMALLPSMSDAPSIGTPEWLAWANWVFPIGGVLAEVVTLLSLYMGWMAVRWALRLIRAA